MKRTINQILMVGVISTLTLIGCRESQTVQPPVNTPTTDAQARQVADDLKRFDAGIEDKAMTQDYDVRDGVLHLKNPAVFTKAMENMADFKAAFSKKNSDFVSFQTLTDQALDKSRAVLTKGEADAFLKQWGRYVLEENEMLLPRLVYSFTSLLSKDGLIYIGKRLYVFTEKEQFIIYDGDQGKVQSAINSKTAQPGVSRMTIRGEVVGSSAPGGRVSSQGCETLTGFRPASGSGRRGYVTVTATVPAPSIGSNSNGEEILNATAIVTLYGYTTKKSGWWWERYRTIHRLRTNYLAEFTVNGTPRPLLLPEPDLISTTEPLEREGIGNVVTHGVNVVTRSEFNANAVRLVIHVRNGWYTSRGLDFIPLPYNQCGQ